MAIKKLYIIGNGFDMHHGIPSSYGRFMEFVEAQDKGLFDFLNKHFYEEWWWSFEEALADLDTEMIADDCINYLESYGSDNWSDADNHIYQQEIDKRIGYVTEDLKKYFTNWILGLPIPAFKPETSLPLDNSAYFINFNYTSTLEITYHVSVQNITYIHNKAVDQNSILILGHSRNPTALDPLSAYEQENADPRIIEGDQALNTYFKQTYKNTVEIIEQHGQTFQALKHVEEIIILGHSLSKVDLPYFQELCKHIDLKKVKWKISCHIPYDKNHHQHVFEELGLDKTLLTFDSISLLETKQLNLL